MAQVNIGAMRDIGLYPLLLGLTPPWRVTGVAVDPPISERKLGEIKVRVEYPKGDFLHCAECEAVMAGCDNSATGCP